MGILKSNFYKETYMQVFLEGRLRTLLSTQCTQCLGIKNKAWGDKISKWDWKNNEVINKSERPAGSCRVN